MSKTQREVYEQIVSQFKLRNVLYFETTDELNRAANFYAVTTTLKEWRRQNEYNKRDDKKVP